MDNRPTAIERAFTLAASGQVNNLHEIRDALKAEGFTVGGHLYGPTIQRQLGKMIAAAKAKP
jgi:hypothetical protein